MKNKKTKLLSLDVSSKVFKNYNEALKTANALKIFTERMIDKENKKGNPYSAYVVIGVSENDPHAGQMAFLKMNMKGRAKKVFIYNDKNAKKVNPHLHVLLYANPADMIAKRIIKYLDKKLGVKSTWKKDCGAYGKTKVAYIADQASAVRTVERNKHGILKDYNINDIKKRMRNRKRYFFTKYGVTTLKDLTAEMGTFEEIQDKDPMECKRQCNGEKKPIKKKKTTGSKDKPINKKRTLLPLLPKGKLLGRSNKELMNKERHSLNIAIEKVFNTLILLIKRTYSYVDYHGISIFYKCRILKRKVYLLLLYSSFPLAS